MRSSRISSELRVDASELAKTILQRLIQSFDEELNVVALAAKARLTERGIPLANPDRSDWELWHSVEWNQLKNQDER